MTSLRAAPPIATVVAVFAHSPIIAAGFGDYLSSIAGIEVAGVTTEIAELVSLVAEHEVTVVVSELLNDFEDPEHLFQLVASAARQRAAAVATVCVIPSAASLANDLRQRGAAAVVSTFDDVDVLRRVILDAGNNRGVAGYPSRRGVDAPVGVIDDFGLTPRELEVLQAIADGLSSKAIAEQFGLSVNTVRTHVQRLLPKLGAHNRLRATAIAISSGLVVPSTRIAPRVPAASDQRA